VGDAGFILALVMLGGGWLLEIVGARRVQKWLLQHDIEHRKGNGIITRIRNSTAYIKAKAKKKEPPVWALAYIGGLITSFGGIILLLYLKGTNRI
jgi:hypothetical protein